MKPGGQGYYEIEKGKVKVGVISVLNSIGNIYDLDGSLLAGNEARSIENHNVMGTTLGVILNNAKLSNSEACKLASVVENGFSSVIKPYNLSLDGDTVFTIATNEVEANFDNLLELAYETARKSVVSVYKG
jgi:L-aminopeptidase/D-esterase-like protein